MTKPDYRALCAELLDELELWSSWHDATDLKDRAAAALHFDQPEPQPPAAIVEMVNKLHQINNPAIQPVAPTDEEIMELMPQPMRDDLATAARALAKLVNHASTATYRIILNRHAVDHARAALAKWGHQ
jgi:hypothetical protein